ncbi:MAG: hypothetical protein LBU21_05000 [Treponema sp.]|jgi:hypothetical protein|nr:hypothetical protein [Treponema sp.]
MVIFRPEQFRRPPLRRHRLLIGAACLVLVAAGVFLFRSPVLLVGDAGFDLIYGFQRTLGARIGLSLRLFRRVERVLIAENADPEAMVFAIEEQVKRPWAVLGPSRYERGLRQYARQREDVRVIIAGEDPELAGEPARSGAAPVAGEPELVFSDVRLNSWRLGRCAALLAGDTGGLVLVFQDRPNFPVHREAFLAGLRAEHENLSPLYLNPSVDYSAWEQVGCVVLAGPSESYLNRDQGIPALLYSWLDPALSPSAVKVIGDDSPWALAYRALSVPAGVNPASYRTLPAAFSIPWGRVGDSRLRGKLKEALSSQIPQLSP